MKSRPLKSVFFFSLWLTMFVACTDDNSVSNKITPPPFAGSPTSNYAPVTAAKLTIDQPEFTGECPHAFQLTGTITTSGRGLVFYQFRDDDAMWAQQGTLEFKSADTKTVQIMTYPFSTSTKYYFGLELLAPKLEIDWKTITTTCQ